MLKGKKGKSPYHKEEVKWIDSCSSSTWKTSEDIQEPVLCYTSGYVVKDTKLYVTIAASICLFTDDNHHISDQISIPKGCIVSRKKIKD